MCSSRVDRFQILSILNISGYEEVSDASYSAWFGHRAEQRQVLRARIVLYAALGFDNLFIARKLACDPKTVRKWRCRL